MKIRLRLNDTKHIEYVTKFLKDFGYQISKTTNVKSDGYDTYADFVFVKPRSEDHFDDHIYDIRVAFNGFYDICDVKQFVQKTVSQYKQLYPNTTIRASDIDISHNEWFDEWFGTLWLSKSEISTVEEINKTSELVESTRLTDVFKGICIVIFGVFVICSCVFNRIRSYMQSEHDNISEQYEELMKDGRK